MNERLLWPWYRSPHFGTDRTSATRSTGSTCTEGGSSTIAANAGCTVAYTENKSYPRYQLGLEVKQPPNGTYKLEVGGKTFTWTDVKVSDFTGGEGFLMLLVKYVVDEKGNGDASDDVLTGIEYKYYKKSAGVWIPATDEELRLIIKGEGGMLSMKFNSNALNVGVPIPKKSSGSLSFATAPINSMTQSDAITTLINNLKAGTQLWSTFSSGAASYDDKLGMRFFF